METVTRNKEICYSKFRFMITDNDAPVFSENNVFDALVVLLFRERSVIVNLD